MLFREDFFIFFLLLSDLPDNRERNHNDTFLNKRVITGRGLNVMI